MKAIMMLILTNAGVMAVIAIILKVFGVDQYLQEYGIASTQFLAFACIYGFAGSFISLLMSKHLAKKQMQVQVIETPKNEKEAWLFNIIKKQSADLGIKMPEVGIFNHPAPNAFATGASKNASLVAVSTGLLNNMTADEVEAVLGHEMSHVNNGDMVTSALIQGTINTFVIIFARLISQVLTSNRDGKSSSSGSYFLVYMILQTVLGFLGSIVVMWHSRHREFAADKGGAALAGRQKMINALKRLQLAQGQGAKNALANDFKAFGIVAMTGLFASHPPLSKRIAALEELTIQ